MTPTRICTVIIIIASVKYINGGFVCSLISCFTLPAFEVCCIESISNVPDQIRTGSRLPWRCARVLAKHQQTSCVIIRWLLVLG